MDFLPAHATSAKARRAHKRSEANAAAKEKLAKVEAKKAAARGRRMQLESTQIDNDPSMDVDAYWNQAPGSSEADMEVDDSVVVSQSVGPRSAPVAADAASTAAGASGPSGGLSFPAVKHEGPVQTEKRRVGIPPHRMTPLKRDWLKIYTPLVEDCGLQVRVNVAKKALEMKTCKYTKTPSIMAKAADFVSAYCLGFAVEDAIALLRLDDLYIESFEIKDVKMLHGDHLSRAIGRIAGHNGKTRFVIENTSKTRVVLADSRIHILGTFENIKVARDAICALILGSPPGKVYARLQTVAKRQRERF